MSATEVKFCGSCQMVTLWGGSPPLCGVCGSAESESVAVEERFCPSCQVEVTAKADGPDWCCLRCGSLC